PESKSITLLDACGGDEILCVPVGPEVPYFMNTGDTVVVAVSALENFTRDFVLDIVAATAVEGDCDNAIDDDLDGSPDCLDPNCLGATACLELACDDGIDDDGDFQIDCLDLDCASDPLCAESCDNGLDDDGDFRVDCDDQGCAGDPACCVTDGTLFGSAGATTSGPGLDQYTPSCALSLAQDVSFEFTAPEAGDYTFDTVGSDFDTVLTVLDGCGGTELACNDDTVGLQSEVTVTLAADQTVLVVVDGYSDIEGSVTVRVR
ncbi:MAG: hypothetical protein AAF211_06850, partial [Myxococcota bacterium]